MANVVHERQFNEQELIELKRIVAKKVERQFSTALTKPQVTRKF
jgi:hypothetical protein